MSPGGESWPSIGGPRSRSPGRWDYFAISEVLCVHFLHFAQFILSGLLFLGVVFLPRLPIMFMVRPGGRLSGLGRGWAVDSQRLS